MVPVDDALNTIILSCEALPPVLVDIENDPVEALNRILAKDVTAADPLPPFRASIMDGYAVIASDGCGEFPVVANITAGLDLTFSLKSGEVAYITTGAPVPSGADAVVKIEDTVEATDNSGATRVGICVNSSPGTWIREIGSDVQEGELILSQGDLITAAEIGLLATVGATQVSVYPKPLVGVISTGNELVPPSAELKPGKIRDSNRSMLLAAASEAHAAPIDMGMIDDSDSTTETAIMEALQRVDILVTSGGVSMGNLDLVKPLLERLGEVKFGRLNMKPGILAISPCCWRGLIFNCR
jgi:gephyrin